MGQFYMCKSGDKSNPFTKYAFTQLIALVANCPELAAPARNVFRAVSCKAMQAYV